MLHVSSANGRDIILTIVRMTMAKGGRVELMEERINNYKSVARLSMRTSSKKFSNLLMLKR